MKHTTPIHRAALTAALLAGLSCVVFLPRAAQGAPKANAGAAQNQKPQPQAPVSGNRLTIEITGGENMVPVENASVYVKFVVERQVIKNKKYELNVKTNREGITHVPDAPMGKVLIQVIAEGWKTFGRWYEITEMKQTIQIHLEKPTRWY